MREFFIVILVLVSGVAFGNIFPQQNSSTLSMYISLPSDTIYRCDTLIPIVISLVNNSDEAVMVDNPQNWGYAYPKVSYCENEEKNPVGLTLVNFDSGVMIDDVVILVPQSTYTVNFGYTLDILMMDLTSTEEFNGGEYELYFLYYPFGEDNLEIISEPFKFYLKD